MTRTSNVAGPPTTFFVGVGTDRSLLRPFTSAWWYLSVVYGKVLARGAPQAGRMEKGRTN